MLIAQIFEWPHPHVDEDWERVYPDQTVKKDRGESCYDPSLPEAIVLKRR